MLRKQRKLQRWRRFGYVILIIIKSGELLLWFSPRIINGLRSYIKHSKGCFIRYPNTLKLVKKNSAAPRFLNHFSVFGYRMKHSSSCLIYYVTSIFNYCTICKTFIQYQDNIKTISSRQLMKIKANIKSGIISWSNTKFFKRTS